MTTSIPPSSSSPVVFSGTSGPQKQSESDGLSGTTLASEKMANEAIDQSSTQFSREQISQALEEVKQALPNMARNLQFSVDEDSGRTVVKVVDTNSNEIIRQIPSEELLAIAKTLTSSKGLLIKQEA